MLILKAKPTYTDSNVQNIETSHTETRILPKYTAFLAPGQTTVKQVGICVCSYTRGGVKQEDSRGYQVGGVWGSEGVSGRVSVKVSMRLRGYTEAA